MFQHQPPGRRRAAGRPGEPATEAASHADMAAVWRGVSQVHLVRARRQRLFQHTLTDDRLAEQLSLLPMLHDWSPVTRAEAQELTYLFDLYAEPRADATPDGVAHAINAAVRRMAARRASWRVPTQRKADEQPTPAS